MAIEIRLTFTRKNGKMFPTLSFRGPDIKAENSYTVSTGKGVPPVLCGGMFGTVDSRDQLAAIDKLLRERNEVIISAIGGRLQARDILLQFDLVKTRHECIPMLLAWGDELGLWCTWRCIEDLLEAGCYIVIDSLGDDIIDMNRYFVTVYDNAGEKLADDLCFASSHDGIPASVYQALRELAPCTYARDEAPCEESPHLVSEDKWYRVSIAMPDDLSMRGLPAKANWLLTSSQYDALKSNAPEEVSKNMYVTEISAGDVAAFRKKLDVVKDAIASAEM